MELQKFRDLQRAYRKKTKKGKKREKRLSRSVNIILSRKLRSGGLNEGENKLLVNDCRDCTAGRGEKKKGDGEGPRDLFSGG